MNKEIKTVYRYDSGGSGFKKAAIFLITLSVLLAIFGVFWILSLTEWRSIWTFQLYIAIPEIIYQELPVWQARF